MKVIRNNIIPFSGFKAVTFWPFVFVRKKATFSRTDETHEKIHGEQQIEMLFIGMVIAAILAVWGCGWWSLLALPIFFYWYGIEWLIKAAFYLSFSIAYKEIGFEREAYQFEDDYYYLNHRKSFKWIKMLW